MKSLRLCILPTLAAAAALAVAGCDTIVISWGGAPRGPIPKEELAFQRVERDYLRYMERNPKDPAAPAQLAERYRIRGDFSRAEELYLKSLGISPKFYFARAGLAKLYLDSGRSKDAVTEARLAAECNPGDAGAYALLARACLADHDLPAARRALADGLRLDPESVELLLLVARADVADNRLAAAEENCRRAIRIDPASVGARTNLAIVLLAAGRAKDAESEARAALETEAGQSTAEAWAVLGRALDARGDSAGAEAAWRKAVALEPGNAGARERLAALLDAQHRTAEAEAQYRELAARNPAQRRALERLAEIAAERGDPGAELAARVRIARAFPEDAAASREAALALERSGEAAAAAAEWERLRQLTPDDVGANLALARLAKSQGKAGAATFHYKAVLAKNPENLAALEGLALMAFEERRKDEAVALYERLVKADPKNAGYHALLGILIVQSGDNARAAEELETAVRLDPKLPQAHRELADVLRKLDQPTRAASEAKCAVELAPADPHAWSVLANIERSAGRNKEALAAYSRAVTLFGDAATPELLWAACQAASDASDRAAAAGFCRKLFAFERERPAATREMARLSASGNSSGEELYWLGLSIWASAPNDQLRRADRARFAKLAADQAAATKALELYRADLARQPKDAAALAATGLVLRLRGDLAAAAEHYEHWLALDPASRPAAAALSMIYAKQAGATKNPKEARRLREKSLGAALRLVAVDRQSAAARLVLARAYGALGRSAAPKPGETNDDLRRQEIELRAVVSPQFDPASAVGHNNLGALLAATGRLAEARAELERAAELAPKAAWPVHNLAVLTEKELADPEVAARHRARRDALVRAGAEPPPEADGYWEFVPEEER